jgi:hypothetical protein
VARSICYELNAWGGRCSKPGGHRGVHVADLGGTGVSAWGFPERGSSPSPEAGEH